MSGNLVPPPLPPKFNGGKKVEPVQPVVEESLPAPVGSDFVAAPIEPVAPEPVDAAPLPSTSSKSFDPNRLFKPFAHQREVAIEDEKEEVDVDDTVETVTDERPKVTFDDLLRSPVEESGAVADEATVSDSGDKKTRKDLKKEKAQRQKEAKEKKKTGTTTWVLLGGLLVVAGGAGAYYYFMVL